jgi:hypothetical protein
VRDAVAGEDADRPVVHLDRDRDLDGLLGLREDADQVRVDREDLADALQLRLRQLERVLAEMRDGRLRRAQRSPSTPITPGTSIRRELVS